MYREIYILLLCLTFIGISLSYPADGNGLSSAGHYRSRPYRQSGYNRGRPSNGYYGAGYPPVYPGYPSPGYTGGYGHQNGGYYGNQGYYGNGGYPHGGNGAYYPGGYGHGATHHGHGHGHGHILH